MSLFHLLFLILTTHLILSPSALVAETATNLCLTPTARASQLTATGAKATTALGQPPSQPEIKGDKKAPPAPDTSRWPAKPWPPGMVWIPAGEFAMGGIGPEARRDEFPIHRVKVDGFWMDATELTNAEFRKFVQATGYVTTAEKKPDWEEMKKTLPPGTPKPPESVMVPGSLVFTPTAGPVSLRDPAQWWQWVPGADWKHPSGPAKHSFSDWVADFLANWKHPFSPRKTTGEADDTLPVVQVSWDDAVAYCKWAGKRLPTEAEWEYASLGGGPARRFVWGDQPPSDTFHPANLWQGDFPHGGKPLDGYLGSAPVGSFDPNGYGLYDMTGNVWEWCSDWYRDDSYQTDAKGSQPSVNPQGPKDSHDPDEPLTPKRVIRGGSFLCNENYCASYRPAARMKSSPDTGLIHTGFRPVMSDPAWRNLLSKVPAKDAQPAR